MRYASVVGLVVLLITICTPGAPGQSTSADYDSTRTPLLLSELPQTLNIHGYVETQFKTAHITPRGLVIADKGVEIQPVGALTFDLYQGDGFVNDLSVTGGVWNSINSSLHDPVAGGWFEIDYFARVNIKLARRFDFSAQYVAFDSPGGGFKTDNNLEFTLSYNDTGLLASDFGFHPYIRLFYNVSGSSTVVLGRNGNTFDAEVGFVPTYVWNALPNYPVTITLPTFVTVGPENFWGGTSNVGVFTTSLAAAVPLSFIPSRFGRWHVDTSISYFNLINTQLRKAAGILGCGTDQNRVVGEMGFGFDF
jgi:hypothetical protein